jgi:hypothetical protein
MGLVDVDGRPEAGPDHRVEPVRGVGEFPRFLVDELQELLAGLQELDPAGGVDEDGQLDRPVAGTFPVGPFPVEEEGLHGVVVDDGRTPSPPW